VGYYKYDAPRKAIDPSSSSSPDQGSTETPTPTSEAIDAATGGATTAATENVTTSNVKQGEKVFFMKARIMAGKLDLAANKLGLSDFKWLAKDELEKELRPMYWKQVSKMLVER